MDAGLLSLKWNNHSSTFFHVLETIRKKELYSDVTIACDGKFFAVHKLVLSTCSDYFQEMFEKTQCKHPVIVLKDISCTDLESLLNYMYIGEVNVLQNELSSLIKAAECLKVKGLAVPDEPPPSKKSSKRQSERDENSSSSSKRNRRNNSTAVESNSDQRDSANTDSTRLTSHSNETSHERVNSQPPESSQYKDFDPSIVKEEKPEEIDNFNESDIGSVVKFEQFDDEQNADTSTPVNPKLGNNDSTYSSSQHQQPMDAMGNFPSTSGYDESSNWSGDIETIEDDDDDGLGEMGDMGNFDPANFLDPSQAKSQMFDPFLRNQLRSMASAKDSEIIQMYMKRENSKWICLYPDCGYSDYNKTKLKTHIRKHTGERPYACPFCQYRASTPSSLYRHIRLKHKIC